MLWLVMHVLHLENIMGETSAGVYSSLNQIATTKHFLSVDGHHEEGMLIMLKLGQVVHFYNMAWLPSMFDDGTMIVVGGTGLFHGVLTSIWGVAIRTPLVDRDGLANHNCQYHSMWLPVSDTCTAWSSVTWYGNSKYHCLSCTLTQ